MAISPDDLQQAGDMVQAAASLREAAARWRTSHPAVPMMVVDAQDIRDEVPTLQCGERRLYLATSNGHCWSVTAQPTEATALILAEG